MLGGCERNAERALEWMRDSRWSSAIAGGLVLEEALQGWLLQVPVPQGTGDDEVMCTLSNLFQLLHYFDDSAAAGSSTLQALRDSPRGAAVSLSYLAQTILDTTPEAIWPNLVQLIEQVLRHNFFF